MEQSSRLSALRVDDEKCIADVEAQKDEHCLGILEEEKVRLEEEGVRRKEEEILNIRVTGETGSCERAMLALAIIINFFAFVAAVVEAKIVQSLKVCQGEVRPLLLALWLPGALVISLACLTVRLYLVRKREGVWIPSDNLSHWSLLSVSIVVFNAEILMPYVLGRFCK